MQLIPVKGSLFENLPLVSNREIMAARKSCEGILPQMYHCRQCRSDAVGPLDEDLSWQFNGRGCPALGAGPAEPPVPQGKPLRIAAASKTGMITDQHFGHAERFYIYDCRGGAAEFTEERGVARFCRGEADCGPAAESVLGREESLENIIASLADCDGVIAMRIGEAPRRRLEERGIAVRMTYDYVRDAVDGFAKELTAKKEFVCQESHRN
jgi:predicted Fe-Mo cluster-binding NifX family protein